MVFSHATALGSAFVAAAILASCSKSALAQKKLRRDIFQAAKKHVHVYFQNLFWAMVAGYIPFDNTSLSYLAREISKVLLALPNERWTEEMLRYYGRQLGGELYNSCSANSIENPAYPSIFWPLNSLAEGECALTEELSEMLGLAIFTRHNQTVELGINFVRQLVRFKESGIGAVCTPIPSLHPQHKVGVISRAQLPEVFFKQLDFPRYPSVPGVREVQIIIDKLNATEQKTSMHRAETLQIQLNQLIARSFTVDLMVMNPDDNIINAGFELLERAQQQAELYL